MSKDNFNLWAFGDAHVGTDLHFGKESLYNAIKDSENDFEWDIAIDVGDMSGGQSAPEDSEGQEIVRQFNALEKHSRESIYTISGNHDRSALDEPPAWWWQKWLDPLGEYTRFSKVDSSKRPYAIKGTWERYSFLVGNILFLMMSDINEPSQTLGRGDLGGNPSGVVSGETFEWWKSMIENNQDKIIVSAHHYVLKDTCVASGDWEGMKKDENNNWITHYHGYKAKGTPIGASYLYFVDSKADSSLFEDYLKNNQGSVDIWLGGHTHTHPDDQFGGKSYLETKWGTHFINVACLSAFHGSTNVPKSHILSFQKDSDIVNVKCYMHNDTFLPKGFYDKAKRSLKLTRMFSGIKC